MSNLECIPVVGVVGFDFILVAYGCDDNIKDISGATTQVIRFRKPDATEVEKTSVYVTDGTDGKIKYVTVADDFDQAGQWEATGKVTISGKIIPLKKVYFEVGEAV